MADDLPPLPAGATTITATPPLPPGAVAIPPPPKGAVPIGSSAKPEQAGAGAGGILSQVGGAAALPFKAAGAGLKSITAEATKEGHEAFEGLRGDLTSPVQGKPKQGVGNFASKDFKSRGTEAPNMADYAARAGSAVGNLMAGGFAIPNAAVKQTIGKSVNKATGGLYDPQAVTDAAMLVGPDKGKFFANLATDAEKLFAKGAESFGGAGKKAFSVSDKTIPPPKGAVPIEPKAPPPLPKGAMPIEGPLTEAPALTQPRKFEDQLFQLESNRVADKLDVMKSIKNAPDVPPATWEKLYHHEENPEGVPLSSEERSIYDQHVAPLKAESNDLTKELEGFGYDIPKDDKGYTPRYVAGRTRSFGEVLDKWKQGVESKFQGGAAARSMRQTVDAQKSRRFYKAVSPDGEQFVVHVGKDGKISSFDPDGAGPEFGTFPKGQKLAPGAKVRVPQEGSTWRLENATTKEIEDVAATRYHKNVLANRLDNVAKLRSAVRNAKFIQSMKASPEWPNVAVKTTDTLEAPQTNGRSWRVPKTPQFQGYYMEPTMADALDDFSGRTRDLDGLSNGLDKAGNVVKGSIFWNPIPHMRNVANHYFIEKGLVGNVKELASGSTGRSLLRAARAVMTQNEDFMRSLRAGASLPYARTITADLHKALTTKLGEDVAKNPTQWDKIAKVAGYANPVEMVKAVYKASNHALWGMGDILNVARQMELAEKGIPLSKAIKMTEEHMPNYRVPGQVLNSRLISQLLQSPVATMFGRYQYNRLASYMHMAKDMVSSETSIKDKAAALDKLAALGVALYLYYPMLDKAWQGITGNKNAKVTRPGAASVPQALTEVAEGQKGPAQAAASIFSPGVVEAPIEAYHGRYLWNGQPIAYPENLTDGHPEQFARDIGSWIGSKISPVGQGQRIVEGTQSPGQFLLSQIGVSTPTDQAASSKQKYIARDAKYAARRAGKKANQRGQ